MALKYLNEDAILATIDNSNNPMEGVRILVRGVKDLRSERDALAKRVEELETLLVNLGDAEMKRRAALGRGDPNPYLYYRSIEDKTVAVMQEGIRIAERRAGRAS